jgi:hypothetical protein
LHLGFRAGNSAKNRKRGAGGRMAMAMARPTQWMTHKRGLESNQMNGCRPFVDHDAKLNWPGAGCRGRVRTKARRVLVKMWGVPAANRVLVFSVLHLGCCSLCSRRRGRSFRRASCRRGRQVRVRLPLCSSAARRGRLLAPSRPPINRSFSVASGCFLSQNRHCSWRPAATRTKGG